MPTAAPIRAREQFAAADGKINNLRKYLEQNLSLRRLRELAKRKTFLNRLADCKVKIARKN
ncbi:MAG: hypothetical protein AVDCRST_MAG74-148 [uncultured Pyrinomonadaceae bacterium]|uniref:Uncharacterized protein n=1 Tax=uncultured Pyrinomonadaceae bacterium TaxID=2283094 RepID=A0A6J4N2C1_9BACT|nr:MAG: hypothetical protein AVDCRST_MAG74-148 [uncultured Pyrinomonadaceae bacterium]